MQSASALHFLSASAFRLAVRWPTAAMVVSVVWIVSYRRIRMSRVRIRIWRRMVANLLNQTVPAVLKPVRVRTNFTALFLLQDLTTRRMPAFLPSSLMKIDNSVLPEILFHNIPCRIQAGKPRSIYSTNPCSVETFQFNFFRLSPV